MVKQVVGTLDPVTYQTRLKEAMAYADISVAALADEIGASYQAVKKVLDGGSKAFTAENNSRAAVFMKVDTDWLATGEGSMPRTTSSLASVPPVADTVNTSTWAPQALQAATLVNMLRTDADRELVLEMINRVVLARSLQSQS